MSIGADLVPEFDAEMASTRKVLERVPADKLDWKAHPSSNSIGWVANHLAEIPGWVPGTMAQNTWDVNPVDGPPYVSPALTDPAQILELFDRNVAAAREALQAVPDADLFQSWSLLSGGQPLFTTTKLGVVRTWVLNHTIHHRAFLCAYLRLNDIPVPGMYGPSGDE
ncbi:MAG: DinB family protein [Planctomycetaceae bacterium]